MANKIINVEQAEQNNSSLQPQPAKAKTNHKVIALLLSIIPGFGQIYNRQILKGLALFVLTGSFFAVFADFLNIGFWGLATLGTEVPRDDSRFLLAYGLISVIITAVGLLIYILNLRDAYLVGKVRDQGKQPNSIRAQYKNLIDNGFPYLMISPGVFLLLFVIILPILFLVGLSFTNYNLYHSPPAKLFQWSGLVNFTDLFTDETWRKTFIQVFTWTIVWTFLATSLQIAIGIILAVIVNQKGLRFKGIIRTILILPWAVPSFVTILVFSGMFNETIGVVNNVILPAIGIHDKPWMTDPLFTRTALILMQGWLGFPFIFAMVTGVLQAIPQELYEAADVDGATFMQKFRRITLPLILYSIAPILITQFTFNFNNFNIIYLFNAGGPAVPNQVAGGTDILISWIYALTMTQGQYGIAAAVTIILSTVVISVALWQFRRTKSFQEEDIM